MKYLLLFGLMFCDIKGEVKNPGVYQINDNNINDIIINAGGLTKDANVNHLNLSKKVTDEMVIYIPNKNDEQKVCSCTNKVVYKECLSDTMITTTTTTTTMPITTKILNTLININTASLEDLKTLTGIGDVIANRVIEYRKTNPFISIEDIMNVKGIGESLFVQIKDFITV